MARYTYTGPGPHDDDAGGLVHPGDVREFDEEPGWGPWELLPEDDGGAESPAEPPAVPSPAPAPERLAAATETAQGSASADAPDTGKGE